MKKLLTKIKTSSLTFIFFFLMSLFVPSSMVQAQVAGPQFAGPQSWQGVCTYTDSINGNTVATIQGLQCLLANVLSVAVTIIGLIAFFIFMISSIKIMVSGGNSKGIEEAKGSMTYAVVGIVVALSAFLILNLLSNFTGINFTQFVIPDPSKVWEAGAPAAPQQPQQPRLPQGAGNSPFGG